MINLHFRYESIRHKNLETLDYFSNKEVSFCVFEDMFLIPKTIKGKSGGIYNRNGELVTETSINKEYGCPRVDMTKIGNFESFSAPCVYLGVYESCWGHFITDCLKKVWFLKSDLFNQFKDYSLIFLSEKSSELGVNQKRLLELLGIDVSRIKIVTKNTLVNKIIIPDSCFFYDENSVMHYTKEYVDLIETVKSKFAYDGNKKYEKIYYSYSRYNKNRGYRKTFGEQKLDYFFEKQGYLIVHPEDYSLD